MSAADGGGLRKRRGGYFVSIPRATIRDVSLSFKARGILGYLLDMPEGWDVRSVSIAKAGTEGRDAVQSGLKELRMRGYYRLERRRMLDGRLLMGSSISFDAVPEWVEQAKLFKDGIVPCVQQPDQSFRVRMPDGHLVDDGFVPEEPPIEAADLTVVSDPDEADQGSSGHKSEHEVKVAGPASRTGTGFSGSGSAGSGSAGSGLPGAGSPGAGKSLPIRRTTKGDQEGTTTTPPADAAAPAMLDLEGFEPASTAIEGVIVEDGAKPDPKALSYGIARGYIDHYESIVGVKTPNRERIITILAKRYVLPALEIDATENQIKNALIATRQPCPSLALWNRALATAMGGRPQSVPSQFGEERSVYRDSQWGTPEQREALAEARKHMTEEEIQAEVEAAFRDPASGE